MRTDELIREYQLGRITPPDGGWEKLVYLAAEMMTMAKQMRNTLRERKTKDSIPSPFTQPDLFNHQQENHS